MDKNDNNHIKNKKIVAITGCAAGIAHTFMAAEGIETAAKELGAIAKVETHGTGGHDNVLTAKDIREADLVLIAADISVDKTRFVGKVLYQTNTTLAIANPQKLLSEAFEGATKYKARNLQKGSGESDMFDTGNIKKEGKILPHIMFSLSWMVPLIITGGLVMAIGNIFAMQPGWVLTGSLTWLGIMPDWTLFPLKDGIYVTQSVFDNSSALQEWITDDGDASNDMWYFVEHIDILVTIVFDGTIYNGTQAFIDAGFGPVMEWAKVWSFEGRDFFHTLQMGGSVAMKLIYPVIAAAIAYSIAGKLSFAPAFIGGWLMNDGDFLNLYVNGQPFGTGFLGAIVMWFFVGYMAMLFRKIKVNRTFKGLCDLMLWPFIMTLIAVVTARYIFSYPLGWITMVMFNIIIKVGEIPGGNLLLAALVAAMICTDLGGPINKTALVAGTAIFLSSQATSMNPQDWNFVPGTAVQAAISIPPLIAFFSVTLFPRFFSNQEKTLGTNASFMGMVGITEGAIPFAVSKPKVFVPANIIGGMTSAVLITAFGFQFYGGLGSPLAPVLGYVPSAVIDSYILSTIIWMSCYFIGALVGVSIVYVICVTTFNSQQKNRLVKEAKAHTKDEIKVIKMKIKEEEKAAKIESLNAKILKLKVKLKEDILEIKVNCKESSIIDKNYKNQHLKNENERWNSEMIEMKATIGLNKKRNEIIAEKEIYDSSVERIKEIFAKEKQKIKEDLELTKDDKSFQIKRLKENSKEKIVEEQSKNILMNSKNIYKKAKKKHKFLIGDINFEFLKKRV